jgi:hypothetical protein
MNVFLMKDYSSLMHYLMQLDMNYIHCSGKPRVQQLEECFEVSMRYWTMVRGKLAEYQFESEEEEIYFFKKIKPVFISESEYYGFLYHLEIFRPVNETDQNAFYLKECQRLAKFIDENSHFYNYYKSGCGSKDELYFLRSAYVIGETMDFHPYDLDLKASTSHDHLVSSILALEKYHLYLKTQLSITCETTAYNS